MKDFVADLQRYSKWANGEVAAALKANDVPQKAVELMSHIVNANILWLARLENRSVETDPWQVYDKKELPELVEKSEDALIDFILHSDEMKLGSKAGYMNSRGEEFLSGITQILSHICIHGAYHRGQIISLIKDCMERVPYTDYIHYTRKVKNH